MTRRKRLGQHFLVDVHVAQKITAAVQLPSPRLILEIGPGKGMLTRYLIPIAHHYIGIEVDPQLAAYLQQKFASLPQTHIINQDFLQTDLPHLFQSFPDYHIAVVGNLPYSITSPILFKLFEAYARLELAVVMVQKEVAERIVAEPGRKSYGILSIFCQLFAAVEYLFTVPASRFFPLPQVDSAVVRFRFRPDALDGLKDYHLFQLLVKTAFQQRRKMLKNSLAVLFPQQILPKLNVNLQWRPEQVSLQQWISLANQLAKLKNGQEHE